MSSRAYSPTVGMLLGISTTYFCFTLWVNDECIEISHVHAWPHPCHPTHAIPLMQSAKWSERRKWNSLPGLDSMFCHSFEMALISWVVRQSSWSSPSIELSFNAVLLYRTDFLSSGARRSHHLRLWYAWAHFPVQLQAKSFYTCWSPLIPMQHL